MIVTRFFLKTFACSSFVVATSPNTFDMVMSLTRITWTWRCKQMPDFLELLVRVSKIF
jgi:hypothetical protein